MKLSDKIRIIRRARGLSQEGLGNSLSRVNKDGISRQTVSDWENANTEPKLENIRDLAEVLNVSFDALLDESIDLNDQQVLNRVLKNTSKTVKTSVNSQLTYSIYHHNFMRRHLKKLLIFGTLGTIGVVSLILGFIFLLNKNKSDDGWALLLQIIGWTGIGFLSGFIATLIIVLTDKKGELIGTLNNSYFIIYSQKDEVNETLYIPLDKVEKVVLGNKGKKKYDDVIITINGRARPVTLKDVQEAKKLIDLYNSLGREVEE